MELCTGKELYHRLIEQKKYKEKDAATATYQMLLAVRYLHEHQVAHRDLKLENWYHTFFQKSSNSSGFNRCNFVTLPFSKNVFHM